jgi:hypothetical protein
MLPPLVTSTGPKYYRRQCFVVVSKSALRKHAKNRSVAGAMLKVREIAKIRLRPYSVLGHRRARRNPQLGPRPSAGPRTRSPRRTGTHAHSSSPRSSRTSMAAFAAAAAARDGRRAGTPLATATSAARPCSALSASAHFRCPRFSFGAGSS